MLQSAVFGGCDLFLSLQRERTISFILRGELRGALTKEILRTCKNSLAFETPTRKHCFIPTHPTGLHGLQFRKEYGWWGEEGR